MTGGASEFLVPDPETQLHIEKTWPQIPLLQLWSTYDDDSRLAQFSGAGISA